MLKEPIKFANINKRKKDILKLSEYVNNIKLHELSVNSYIINIKASNNKLVETIKNHVQITQSKQTIPTTPTVSTVPTTPAKSTKFKFYTKCKSISFTNNTAKKIRRTAKCSTFVFGDNIRDDKYQKFNMEIKWKNCVCCFYILAFVCGHFILGILPSQTMGFF